MRSFKDKAEREWTMSLTLGSSKRVHAETGVWLSDLHAEGSSPIDRVAHDSGFLGMVVWTLCKDQVTAAGLSEDEFLDAFDGPTVEASRDALIEEMLDFLGHRGALIRETLAQRKRLAAEIEEEELTQMMGLTGPQVLQLTHRLLLGRSTATAGSAPATAESTEDT
jgi:hypothetical protein